MFDPRTFGLLAFMEKLVAEDKRKLRDDTIEECARVADDCLAYANGCNQDTAVDRTLIHAYQKVAAAIRALKSPVAHNIKAAGFANELIDEAVGCTKTAVVAQKGSREVGPSGS